MAVILYESTNQTFGYILENLNPLRPINREDVCALNPFFYFANVPSICDLPATALHTVLVWSLGGSNLYEPISNFWINSDTLNP